MSSNGDIGRSSGVGNTCWHYPFGGGGTLVGAEPEMVGRGAAPAAEDDDNIAAPMPGEAEAGGQSRMGDDGLASGPSGAAPVATDAVRSEGEVGAETQPGPGRRIPSHHTPNPNPNPAGSPSITAQPSPFVNKSAPLTRRRRPKGSGGGEGANEDHGPFSSLGSHHSDDHEDLGNSSGSGGGGNDRNGQPAGAEGRGGRAATMTGTLSKGREAVALFASNPPPPSADLLFGGCGPGTDSLLPLGERGGLPGADKPDTGAPTPADFFTATAPPGAGGPPQPPPPPPPPSLPNPWGSSPQKAPQAPPPWSTMAAKGFDCPPPLSPSPSSQAGEGGITDGGGGVLAVTASPVPPQHSTPSILWPRRREGGGGREREEQWWWWW
ncbi:unnamed protein product [Discosporangium mesarthrocarpum]